MESAQKIVASLIEPLVAFIEADIAPLVDKTVIFRIEALEVAMAEVAGKIGLDPGSLKLVVGMFMVYPLTMLYCRIPTRNVDLRHLYNIFVGVWLAQFAFGGEWIHTLTSGLGTYLILCFAPRSSFHHLNFMWALAYMSVCHIYMMYTNYMFGRLDFTGTQMVLTIKLCTIGYNLFDGTVDYERVKQGSELDEKAAENPSLSRRQKSMYGTRLKYSLTSVPNIYHFISYIFCFNTLLAGPAFEFITYKHSVGGFYQLPDGADVSDSTTSGRGGGGTSNGTKDGAANGSGRKKIVSEMMVITDSRGRTFIQLDSIPPGAWRPTLLRFAQAVGCMAIYLTFLPQFPIIYCTSQEFITNVPIYGRFAYLYVSLFCYRMKFYFAWKLSEGSCNMGGYGYQITNTPEMVDNGTRKVVKTAGNWDGINTVDILTFEWPKNSADGIKAWNKRTQHWLANYVHLRWNDSLIVTYFVSAFWHGFYPGYYLFFMSVPLVTIGERMSKKKLNPIFFDGASGVGKRGYAAICTVVSLVIMNYLAMSFNLYKLGLCWAAWWGAYYCGPHLVTAAFIVLMGQVGRKNLAVLDKLVDGKNAASAKKAN